MKVYIVLADTDGTIHSQEYPTGKGFKSRKEAEKYIKNNNIEYSTSIMEIEVV